MNTLGMEMDEFLEAERENHEREESKIKKARMNDAMANKKKIQKVYIPLLLVESIELIKLSL